MNEKLGLDDELYYSRMRRIRTEYNRQYLKTFMNLVILSLTTKLFVCFTLNQLVWSVMVKIDYLIVFKTKGFTFCYNK